MVLAYTVPIPINKTYNAKEIKLDDPTYVVDRQIEVSGYYYINLFTTDVFKGRITVSGYPRTATAQMDMRSISINRDGAVLDYYYTQSRDEAQAKNHLFGMVFSKRLLGEMCILPYTQNYTERDVFPRPYGGWDTASGYCIAAGVSSREQVLDLLIDQYRMVNAPVEAK